MQNYAALKQLDLELMRKGFNGEEGVVLPVTVCH